MTTSPPSAPASALPPDDLFTLILVDGLGATTDQKTIHYRTVRLRETTVGDERTAARLSERAVPVGGSIRLLSSESDFRYAMTLMHIEQFECDGQIIPRGVLDLGMLDKLSPHDLQLIEQRVFLIGLAAELRYGTITQEQFDALADGRGPKGPAAPQPNGQAAGVGPADHAAEPGPAVLADFTRGDASGPAQGHGR